MKNLIRIILVAGILLSVSPANAQTADFDKDLLTFMEISGSTATYDLMYDQLTAQLKMMKPGVPDSLWVSLKTEVYNQEVKELTKQLVPLYKKHFTHADVKELISFYNSPTGKKLAAKTPLISQEAMQLGQTWGMGLMGKLNGWLTEKGY